MRLFRPLTSFFCSRALPPRPSAFPCFPPSRLSSLSASAHPSRRHPPVLSSSSELLSLFRAACRHLIACLCDGSLPLPRHHAKRISPSHHVRARACPRSRSSACAFMCPSASVMAGGHAGPSTQCARDRPTLPAPVGHPAHGQNALWRWCP